MDDYAHTLTVNNCNFAVGSNLLLPIEARTPIEGEAKAVALAAADVFLPPSYLENFGIAGEVRAADAGRLVAPERCAIAVALAQLLDDDEERKRIQRGLAFARREYSTAAIVQRLRALYASLAQSCRERPA
jgi:glycosyltransferase involved in cell wall biosynthesis